MKLTPIRVRGKRGQPKPEKKKSNANGLDETDLQGLQGPPAPKRASKHRAKLGEPRLKKGLSRLSQLPQEVLERVFVASQNLSLPLVSRDLHHRLSSDSIKYQMVGAAFGPTWDGYYGLDKFETSSYDGWQWDISRIEGDHDFQVSRALLGCSICCLRRVPRTHITDFYPSLPFSPAPGPEPRCFCHLLTSGSGNTPLGGLISPSLDLERSA